MVKIDNWGELLKDMIKQSGVDQKDVADYIGMSAQLYSTKLKDNDIKIQTILGTLEFLKVDLMTLLYKPSEVKKYLPDYISETWNVNLF
jgi:transcriptional regulator with XRE-family HTH domain